MGRNPRRVVHKTLSDSSSAVTIACYGTQGVGRWHHAPLGAEVVLVLINEARQVREVCGKQVGNWDVRTEAIGFPSGWFVLGWRMADGSLPRGPLDAVDPTLADLDRLPEVNRPPRPGH